MNLKWNTHGLMQNTDWKILICKIPHKFFFGEITEVPHQNHAMMEGSSRSSIATSKLYSQTMMKLLKNYDEYKVIIDMINL